MKKNITIIGLTVAMLLLGIQTKGLSDSIQLKDENIKIIESKNDDLYEKLKNANQQVREYKNKIDKLEQENIELSKYKFYDIPLTYEQQKFVADLSEEFGLSFELIISMMKIESNYQTDLISETLDYGIMQLNSKNHEFFAKLSGLEIYDVMDFYDNVTMGVNYLAYLRDYWIGRGITSEEELYFYIINSYNQGCLGYTIYKERTGLLTRTYDQKITAYKSKLEQSLNT